MYFQQYGSIKPGVMEMDLEHPFSLGALIALGFNDWSGRTGVGNPITSIIPNSLVGSQIVHISAGSVTGMVLASNQEGNCLNIDTSGGGGSGVIRVGIIGSWLPTTECTVLLIRRAATAIPISVNRVFHVDSPLLECLLPFLDGTVYWDYGSQSAPNRLTAAGLTFSTKIPDRWIFTAGPRGSTIWQNGIKRASQSTSISRVVSTTPLELNYDGESGDWNFFQINNVQWSDDLCQWWSASPYEHLYQPILKNYFFFGQPSFSIPPQPSNTRVQPIGNVSPTVRQYVRF